MLTPVLMNDPRVVSTTCRTDGPLPLVTAPGRRVVLDSRKADASGFWQLLRQPVRERLWVAADSLPDGLALMFVEGYRPLSLQARYFDEYLQEVRSTYQSASEEEAQALASRHVAPPTVAPHCSGAAVDVTLATSEGAELDLGSPVNATPEESGGRCYTDHPAVTGEQARLRGLLIDVLSGAGFVNYPPEWWHWSFGDRYWATLTGHPEALFDAVAERDVPSPATS